MVRVSAWALTALLRPHHEWRVCFSGRGGFLLDVLDLPPDMVEEAEADEETEATTPEPSPKKPKA